MDSMELEGALQNLSLNVLLRNITRYNPQSVVGLLPVDIVAVIGSKLSPLMLLIYEYEIGKRGVKTSTLWCDALDKRSSFKLSSVNMYHIENGGQISSAREVYIHCHFQELLAAAIETGGNPSNVQVLLANECLDKNELSLCTKLTISHFVPYISCLSIKASQIERLSDLALNQLVPFLKTIKVCHITNGSFFNTIRLLSFFVRYGKQPKVHIIDYNLKAAYCKILMNVLSGFKTVACPSFNQEYIDAIPSIHDIITCNKINNCSMSFIKNQNCSESNHDFVGGITKIFFGNPFNDESDYYQDYIPIFDYYQKNRDQNGKENGHASYMLSLTTGNSDQSEDTTVDDLASLNKGNAHNQEENCTAQILENGGYPGIRAVFIMFPMLNAEECMINALCNQMESWPDLEQMYLQLVKVHSARLVTRYLLQIGKSMKKVVLECGHDLDLDLLVPSLFFDLIGQSLMGQKDKPLIGEFICGKASPGYCCLLHKEDGHAQPQIPAAPFTLTFQDIMEPKPFAGVVELSLSYVSYDDKAIAYFIENDACLKGLSISFLPAKKQDNQTNLCHLIANKKTLTSIKLSNCQDLFALTPALLLDILRQNWGLTYFDVSYYDNQARTDTPSFLEDLMSVIKSHPTLLSLVIGHWEWNVDWLQFVAQLIDRGHPTTKLEHVSVKQFNLSKDDFTALDNQLQQQSVSVTCVLKTFEFYGFVNDDGSFINKRGFFAAYPGIRKLVNDIKIYLPFRGCGYLRRW